MLISHPLRYTITLIPVGQGKLRVTLYDGTDEEACNQLCEKLREDVFDGTSGTIFSIGTEVID